MRTMAMVALAALLAACGDDDDDNGGGGSSIILSGGTITGTLSNGAAVRAAGTCDLPVVGSSGVAVAIVAVSTHGDLCTAASAGQDLANATTLQVALLKFSTSATTTALDVGSYESFDPLGGSLPLPDGSGNIRIAVIQARTTGGAATAPETGCAETAFGESTGGTVTVSSVTADSISGSITATLDTGTTVSGTFSAPTCNVTISVDPASCEPTGIPDAGTCG